MDNQYDPNQGYQDPNANQYNYGNGGQQDYNQYGYNNGYNNQPNYNGYQNQPINMDDPTPMTIGQWLLTIIVLAIPCVGIIMYFVWAFGTGNVNRKNYCRACLIITAVVVVLWILMSVLFGAMFSAALSGVSRAMY